jgi:hypothetical protein
MRQFMQACLYAFPDVVSVVRADLDPTLKGVSVTASLSTHQGHGVGVCRERSLEPFHLLDGMPGGWQSSRSTALVSVFSRAGETTELLLTSRAR